MMAERAMNFATIWYGIVNDLRFASNAREHWAKCTGRLKSVDSILRSKARLAALDP